MILFRTLWRAEQVSLTVWDTGTTRKLLSSAWDWWKWSNLLRFSIPVRSCRLSSKAVEWPIWLRRATVAVTAVSLKPLSKPKRVLRNWRKRCWTGSSSKDLPPQKKLTSCWRTRIWKPSISIIFIDWWFLIMILLNWRFPLFTAVHRICSGEIAPEQMIDCIRNHPEHMWVTVKCLDKP